MSLYARAGGSAIYFKRGGIDIASIGLLSPEAATVTAGIIERYLAEMRSEIDELSQALLPFAKVIRSFDAVENPLPDHFFLAEVSLGDWRKAAKLIGDE